MCSLAAIASLLLAYAVPATLAVKYCEDGKGKTFVRYIDGKSQADFEGYADAYAAGDDTITFVGQNAVSDPETIIYTAEVVGATADDDGVIAVVNEFNGKVVDCDYIVRLRKNYFKKKPNWRCAYKIDPEIKEICESAQSELSATGFVKGSGAIAIESISVQELPDGFAASAVDLAGTGSEGILADVESKDTVINRNGSRNEALARVAALLEGGNSDLTISTTTSATPDSSSSSSYVKGSVKSSSNNKKGH